MRLVMHIFSIDDSGTIPPPNKITQGHFILGGLSIPEEQWHNLERDFSQICKQFSINGEVKWRFFGQKIGREDKTNTLTHLSLLEKDQLRSKLLTSTTKYPSVKIIIGVVHLPTIYSMPTMRHPKDVYHHVYGLLTDRFSHHLQDLTQKTGSKIHGIMISDHRNPAQDQELRNSHIDLMNDHGTRKPKYENLIENLFLSPSHHSIGVQFADFIAGAAFRYIEHGDERWYNLIEPNILRDASGEINGHGLVKIPDVWKEKDAESREPLEPALMTQSQRTLDTSKIEDFSP